MERVRLGNNRETEIRKQLDEAVQTFSELTPCEDFPNRWVLRGNIHFAATYQDCTIEDSFTILISLPQNYPNDPPTVQETGGRIQTNFHINPDRTLCLGAPLAVRMKFFQNRNLLSFINDQIIPYLYSFRYWQDKGKMPFGDLPHGWKGIFKYYQTLFEVNDRLAILSLLKILAYNNYHGHLLCPCNSGLILRRCHGMQLQKLFQIQSSEKFKSDLISILINLLEEEKHVFNRDTIPKDLFEITKEVTSKQMRRSKGKYT